MSWNLSGSIVALVTPFCTDGSVDFVRLGGLIDFQLAHETDAILVLGTTGESATMTHEEDEQVLAYTLERVGGRVPVIAGSGSNDTAYMVRKSKDYHRMGVDGLLLVSPYYNKTNDEGMYRHFMSVADTVDTPCILYNVPGRTGCSISVPVVERLATHPNVAGIKEASGDISYAMRLAHLLDDSFSMYAGNDDCILPLLSIGARGAISVLANICPRETHELVCAFLAGNLPRARALQLRYLELVHNLFTETNPIPVKTALNLMGLGGGVLRMPLYRMSAPNEALLCGALERLGLLSGNWGAACTVCVDAAPGS